MADRVQAYDVTVPSGTVQAAPLVTALPFTEGRVQALHVTFPDGCVGLVGAQVSYGGRQVIPANEGTFLRANGRTIAYPLQGYPTGDRWQLVAYNTDVYGHSLIIEIEVNDLSTSELAAITPIPVELIS